MADQAVKWSGTFTRGECRGPRHIIEAARSRMDPGTAYWVYVWKTEDPGIVRVTFADTGTQAAFRAALDGPRADTLGPAGSAL